MTKSPAIGRDWEKPLKLLRKMKRLLFPEVTGAIRPRASDYSIAVPLACVLTSPAEFPPVAVVCHIFNVDLASEIHSYISNIPTQRDLYISTDTEEKASLIREEFASFTDGRVEVRVAPNRGRDIASKYVTFEDVYDRHDLILFLHSKKTGHLSTAADWRRSLMGSLSGSPEIVAGILGIFARNDKIGIVFPQHYRPIRPYVNWAGVFPQARRLANRMGIELRPNQIIDFAAGSMFWARSAALLPILSLNLGYEDFPQETGQTDGTIAHILERLLLYSCEKAGYDWLKVSTKQFCDTPQTLFAVKEPQDFDRFMEEHRIRILN